MVDFSFMREIIGVYTEPVFKAKVVNLKRSVAHTTVFPDGKGFSTEAFDRVFESKRKLVVLGWISPIPLPSRKEPFRYVLPQPKEYKLASELWQGDNIIQVRFAPKRSLLQAIA